MTKDEALKLALEALDKYGFAPCDKEEDWQGFKRAITAIKEALAQTQEPVRIMGFNCKCGRRMEVSAEQGVVPAPQLTWVGLNKEEAFELQVKHKGNPFSLSAAVENLLREKNQ